MKRRALSILLVLVLSLGLISCGNGGSVENSGDNSVENSGDNSNDNRGDNSNDNSTENNVDDGSGDGTVSTDGRGDGTVSTDVGDDGTDETEEVADYSDIVYDRSATEGRFAVYYLQYTYSRPKAGTALGGGDASLLIAPDGTTMLIDCNMSPITGKIVYYLQELGIEKLDYLMISHTDEDHVGGMNALLAYIQVDHILVSGSPYYFTNTSEAGRLVGKAIDMGASYTVLTAGMEMDFGGVNMKVYWPSADYEWPESQTGFVINNNSLVVKFTYGESSFLFAGDIYMEQEIALTEMYGEELHADVVKMNHHGHNTSNSLKWLTAVEPKLTCGMACAVFSSTVLNRYTYLGITFTLGALDGSVVVCTDGDGTYDVQVEKEREETYYGVLPATDGAFRIE